MFSFLGSDFDFEPSTSSPPAVPTEHVCETCGICSESEEALLKHNVIHDLEKCHMCTVCRWHCKSLSDMITHIQTHTTSNEQHTEDLITLMFSCILCSELFSNREELLLHYNTHNMVRANSLQHNVHSECLYLYMGKGIF